MMTDLEIKIRDAAQRYYTDGSSPYTDEEFDAMIEELRNTNPDSELFRTGWGYNVFEDSTPGEKVKHLYGRAGSLDKCRTYAELNHKLRGNIRASLKLDGLSVVLYYKDGVLNKALTRGDGEYGIDITEKARMLVGNTIKSKNFTGAVRGEILMRKSEFIKFKEKHPEAKNSRNSAAGLVNAASIGPDFNHLNLVVYSVVGDDSFERKNLTLEEYQASYTMDRVYTWLYHNFKDVVPNMTINVNEDNFIVKMNMCRECWYALDWPADGIVLTHNNLFINIRTHEITYDSQAFKFKAEAVETEVEYVEWNLTKNRYLMPRIKIKECQLSGTDVNWATGYNAQYIRDNWIGEGAIVEVEKHGEIIPNINKVISPGHVKIPNDCPECGTELIWNGVHLMCPNKMCNNASTQDLLVWLENVCPVEGFGDTLRLKYLTKALGEELTIERVMDGEVKKVLQPFAGFGAQFHMFTDMIESLYNNDKKVSLSSALAALNIPRLGNITAEKLAANPGLVQKMLEADDFSIIDMSMITNSLIALVGTATTESIIQNYWKVNRLNLIKDKIDFSKGEDTSTFVKVAVTGKLSVKRNQFESELKSHGYLLGDISKDTKFLITDDPNSSSSKNKKADQLGIEKITEADFRNRYL